MERRTITELATLYELEPSVRDIYVEGPTDRAFVMAIVRRSTIDNVQVREVDQVNISTIQLQAFGLTPGSRQRVVALAMLLERESKVDLTRQVICIADADEEAGCTPLFSGALLVYTDFSSMTMYAFESKYIQWYLDIEVLGFPLTGAEVMSTLVPVLREVSLVRRAFRKLGIHSELVDVTKDCAMSGRAIKFDEERFLRRSTSKANMHTRFSEIVSEIQKCSATLASDARLWIGAQDFLSVFHWLIVELRGSSNTVAERLLGRTLLLGIPIADVTDWSPFREIFARLPSV